MRTTLNVIWFSRMKALGEILTQILKKFGIFFFKFNEIYFSQQNPLETLYNKKKIKMVGFSKSEKSKNLNYFIDKFFY